MCRVRLDFHEVHERSGGGRGSGMRSILIDWEQVELIYWHSSWNQHIHTRACTNAPSVKDRLNSKKSITCFAHWASLENKRKKLSLPAIWVFLSSRPLNGIEREDFFCIPLPVDAMNENDPNQRQTNTRVSAEWRKNAGKRFAVQTVRKHMFSWMVKPTRCRQKIGRTHIHTRTLLACASDNSNAVKGKVCALSFALVLPPLSPVSSPALLM